MGDRARPTISARSRAKLLPNLHALLSSSEGLWEWKLNTRVMKSDVSGLACTSPP